jgi:putative aminopeptidase FrvX
MRKAAIGVLILAFVSSLPAGSQTSPQGPASSWDILRKLVLVPGMSGQEAKAADFIQAMIPASLKPQRDMRHNVWFTVGEGKPHIMFVAHMDELGYTVDKVTEKGTVLLKPYTAFLPQVSESRAFIIHTAKGPVEGVIMPAADYYANRTAPTGSPARGGAPASAAGNPPQGQAPPPAPAKAAPPAAAGQAGQAAQAPAQPPAKPAVTGQVAQGQSQGATPALEVYLGVSTEQEARALGVAEGNPVLVKKKLVDISPDIMATRAVDDRAGCAALLAAMLRLDWSKVRGRTVTFAWDVEEESGLLGAQVLVKTIKPDYVFALDTFVSTDTPLENKRFGNAVLGKGAVLRSIDTSSITPKMQIARVAKLAASRGIPIQIGNSRGGNDGSVFVTDGAVDIPLSWPGVHAHSFIEKIDRNDLEALTKLVEAIVEEWK